MFVRLPRDIICSHIVSDLNVNDINNLAKTSKIVYLTVNSIFIQRVKKELQLTDSDFEFILAKKNFKRIQHLPPILLRIKEIYKSQCAFEFKGKLTCDKSTINNSYYCDNHSQWNMSPSRRYFNDYTDKTQVVKYSLTRGGTCFNLKESRYILNVYEYAGYYYLY